MQEEEEKEETLGVVGDSIPVLASACNAQPGSQCQDLTLQPRSPRNTATGWDPLSP